MTDIWNYTGNDKIKDHFVDRIKDDTYAKEKAVNCLIEHFVNPIQQHAGEKIVELLVKGGANINQKDKDGGMTPYDEADAFGI